MDTWKGNRTFRAPLVVGTIYGDSQGSDLELEDHVIEDAIEREIFIRAGIDHVWSLVSRAGFWVGDELHFDAEAREGEAVVIDTTKYGQFPVIVDRLEPPHYAAYRWASAYPGAAPTETNSTLVEFTLVEQGDGVVVRLRESGFAALDGASDFRASRREDNVAGWELQLGRLRDVAERVRAS